MQERSNAAGSFSAMFLKKPSPPVAVGASRDRDDDAAFVERCFSGGHALDGLVDVLVER